MIKNDDCPRIFTDKQGRSKNIYCGKWTCEACAPRKLRRLIATSTHTASINAPLVMLTLRGIRLSYLWNRFTQRIRRPYIGIIEHKPDPHIHAIIQRPPREAPKIWQGLGGTYYHTTPVHEYNATVKYITKTLTEENSQSRLIRSRDWHLATLGQALNEVIESIEPPAEPEVEHQAVDSAAEPMPPPAGGSTTEDIIEIIRRLPKGTIITFNLIKDDPC